jgi:YtkA-like
MTPTRDPLGTSKRWWLCLALPCAAACSSQPSTGSSASGDTGDDSGTVGCLTNPGPYPVDTYSANMTRTGSKGALKFELVSSDPAPPAQGNDTFVVKISHADGSPFAGDLVIPERGVWMPAHGHGPSVVPIVTFDASQNAYSVAQVNLFMLGVWRLTFDAYETAAATDAAMSVDAADAAGAASSSPPLPTDESIFYFCLD